MRKKILKLVVTFHTTTAAMQMEAVCKERNVQGRLIPVPREITAGCGLAWCANIEDKDEITGVMDLVGLESDRLYECMV